MVDLETLGVNPGCAILSIAAVRFDIKTGNIQDRFYVNLDLSSCIDHGLVIEADTFLWWLKQSQEARERISQDPVYIVQALLSLNSFIAPTDIVWGNSARFDFGILIKAYEVAGINIPWKYRHEMCLRTIVSLNPMIRDEEEFTGTPHNALHDCEHQIKYLVKIMNSLTINTETP